MHKVCVFYLHNRGKGNKKDKNEKFLEQNIKNALFQIKP